MPNIRKRKDKNGDVRYTVQIRKQGHKTLCKTFGRLEDAKRWEKKTSTEVEQGTAGLLIESQKHTLSEAIDRYVREVNPDRNDSDNRKMHLEWFKEKCGKLSLFGVTAAVLNECQTELRAGTYKRGRSARSKARRRSAATVNRYMAAISHVLTYAVEKWEWLNLSPIAKVGKLAEPGGRVRYLSDAERTDLLAACRSSGSPYLYARTVLALYTGARAGEIDSLTWSQVDLKKKVAILNKTKNGDRRRLHLHGEALTVLEEVGKVRRIDSDLVFPGEKNPKVPWSFKTAWEGAVNRAGLKDFRFHDLRHTAASYLAMNGATTSELAEVLGHKTLAMVKRYSHLSESHVSSVVERTAAKMDCASKAVSNG